MTGTPFPSDLRAIQAQFHRLNLTVEHGLNLINENHLISDEVITINDIAPSDAKRALAWLKEVKCKTP